MLPPELPPLPALTRAEGAVVDGYVEVLNQVGRANPAYGGDTYRALRAAQALVAASTAFRDAVRDMHDRGESELYAADLSRALRVLGAERRAARVALPPPR